MVPEGNGSDLCVCVWVYLVCTQFQGVSGMMWHTVFLLLLRNALGGYARSLPFADSQQLFQGKSQSDFLNLSLGRRVETT